MSERLNIVVVEKDPNRARLIVDGLLELDDHNIHIISEETALARKVAERKPDIVLIDLTNPSRDTLEELAIATSPLERPVAIFVDRSDHQLTRAAIEAGVSAYVVGGLQPERLRPILDAAITRFHMFHRMRTELAATRRALEERKTIDRAKGILMKARRLDEEGAYALLRKTAMDRGKKVIQVAEALVTASEMLS